MSECTTSAETSLTDTITIYASAIAHNQSNMAILLNLS